MSMVEKVARAIWLASTLDGWTDDPDERQSNATGQLVRPAHYADVARAAIESLHEPTEAMRIAALTCGMPARGTPPLYEMVWRAMLDAALKEGVAQEQQSDLPTPR